MSLNMYLGEVQNQTQSMNAVCTATIQGMEQAIQSIDAFAIDTVLQGQTYSSAKAFFAQTFRPLAQGIIYLCEELIVQNDAFPSQFESKVASTDVIEQEILEQIQEIDRMKASMEVIIQTIPIPGMDAMANLFTAMRKKLQEKLDHLYEFNQTSSNNYSSAIQLAASIATGLAEVQSGKGFSPASGTFSTQGLNMEWTTSIQSIGEERARQAENHLKSSSIEEGAICGKLPEKSTFRKVVDGTIEGAGEAIGDTIEGFKALGKRETWENMGNAALHPIDTLSTMYNVVSDSFINDVINGDAESRAKWGSYALTQVAVGVIGDKGLSKASKLGKVATKKAKEKIPEVISHTIGNLQMGDRFVLAGMGSMKIEIPTIKDYFVKASNGMNVNTNVGNAKRPGGYQKGDIDEHGYLSPAVNRAPGNKNIAADKRIQSHHPIQNEWAKRWAKKGGFDYSEKKAQAILLPSSSGLPHAKISAMQRKRRRLEGYDTDIYYEFNVSYREMIEAGVDQKIARKVLVDAYKYFDSLGGFVKNDKFI
ncbi:T7SS effector LXG polymorphic toxin [Bacillus sp. TL12]|uniref:T7SS effector LXG polymorphic toxin n=1 Tax=Bacillus sp. TL12 TaxID=2894756 RepID=UPI001F51887D|nr:T7SS effector LXG polymorphic toxin [Bacillus sp. TL12]MCI0766277.1 cytoplasmic protein [Bacillus sp. TL12]